MASADRALPPDDPATSHADGIVRDGAVPNARFKVFLDALQDGFCIVERIAGEPVDFRYVTANPAFERHTGLPPPVGRTVRQLVPDIDEALMQRYVRVAATGEPDRLDAEAIGRHFEAELLPTGTPGQVAVLFRDITARRRTEAALRASEERKAFLLALGDALRGMQDANAMIEVAARLLGERLGATRVLFAEFDAAAGLAHVLNGWSADGAAPFPTMMHLADYEGPVLDDLRAGRVVRIDDTADPALARPDLAAIAQVGVAALLSIPRCIADRLVANLSVHQCVARHWTDDEVALAHDVAERLWAEVVRARTDAALRVGKEQLRLITDAVPALISYIDTDLRYRFTNKRHQDWFGVLPEEVNGRCVRDFLGEAAFERLRPHVEAALAGRGQNFEAELPFRDGGTRYVRSEFVPDIRPDGSVAGYYAMVVDITARKRAQDALRETHERQAFLLRLSDALRAERDPDAVGRVAVDMLARYMGVDRCYVARSSPDGLGWVGPEHHAPDLMPIAGEYRVRVDFPKAMRQLESGPLVIEDVGNDPALSERDRRSIAAMGMQALLVGALRRGDEFVWGLAVGSARPRAWTDADRMLVEETADRAWAAIERARAEAALRESEERLRAFGEASQDVLWIRDAATLQWRYLTAAFETIYGARREDALAGNDFENWLALIVPDDRGHVREHIRRVQGGEQVAFEYRIRRPVDGAIRWVRNTDFPIRDARGQVVLIAGIGHDFTVLREAELRLHALVEGIPQLVWRAGEPGLWTWASPQWTRFTGQSEADSLGWGWLDPVHPDDRDTARAGWAEARSRGAFEAEYRIRDQAGGAYRWFRTRAAAVRDETGRIVEWVGTSTDIDDLRELQQRQQVLVAELQHRTFNLMGIVRSTADATARRSADLDEFKGKFRERIAVLARVQRLLSKLHEDERVTFDELVRGELEAVGAFDAGDRVRLQGPDGVALRSSTVQTFAMAIHELATNALKYGALRQRDARLEVRWRVEAGDDGVPWLHVDWTERGVAMPSLERAQGTGQGRELIEKALPYQLRARTDYRMTPDGVHCSIALPVSLHGTREAGHAAP